MALLLTLVTALEIGAKSHHHHRHHRGLRGDVSPQDEKRAHLVHTELFHHELYACNAFPDQSQVSVTLNRKEKLATLAYKQCSALPCKLQEGDQLDFDSQSIGQWTFRVASSPHRTPSSSSSSRSA